MRSAVGIFGFICGLIVIALVGRYGYMSTDVEADAYVVAFLFGAVAAGGLFGHAVAAHLWPTHKITSLFVGLVCVVALLLNLSNSLGAMAGRADHVTRERISKNRSIKAAEAELKRLTDLRIAMPTFVSTDTAVVDAAKRAADAATTAKERECGNGNPKQRGDHCRDREWDERDGNAALAKASSDRAATDRATGLEADAKVQRDKLAELGPAVVVNVQGSAIARLFRLPESEVEFASTAQQFGIAVVVEVLIVMCMVAWELLGRGVKIVSAVPGKMKIMAHSKPKLLTSANIEPAGSVVQIMTEALRPADGERVEFCDAYKAYVAGCKARGRRAVAVEQFAEALKRFCEACDIPVSRSRGHAYLRNVRCVPNQSTSGVGDVFPTQSAIGQF